MKVLLSLCLLLTVFSLCIPAAAAEEENPALLTFTLPLPHGRQMEFALVLVREDANPFSSYGYDMGAVPFNKETKEKATYANTQAYASVAGTVSVLYEGKTYRAIPMARTETTQDQYQAVMNADGKNPEKKEDGDLPQTNISRAEIELFTETLNRWWFTHPDEVTEAINTHCPTAERTLLFARLPLESEWEFAARGGIAVSSTFFKSGIPYENEEALQAHEVLNTNTSSGEIFPVRSTGLFNPVGLYDMLGNVREMVADSFRPEYNFGRVGGMLVCGGSAQTDYTQADASLREELCPFNEENGGTCRDEITGFRLVIGSIVSAQNVEDEKRIQAQWRSYRDTLTTYRNGEAPGDEKMDGLAQKAQEDEQKLKSLQEATLVYKKQLEQVQKEQGEERKGHESQYRQLEKNVTALNNEINSLRSEIENTRKRLDLSQREVARGALFLICDPASEGVKNMKSAMIAANSAAILTDPTAKQRALEHAEGLRSNFPGYWRKFDQGCIMLSGLPEDIVNEAVEEHRREMKTNVDKSPENSEDYLVDIRSHECAIRLACDYTKNKKHTFLKTGITPEKWISYILEEVENPAVHKQTEPMHTSPRASQNRPVKSSRKKSR